MAGVALADALGGAAPTAVLLGPAVLGLAPVVAERVEGLGLGLRLEGLVAEGRGVDVLAGPGAGRRGVLRGGLHGLLLDVAGVALADALGGAVPAAVLLGPAVLGLAPVVAEGGDFLGFGLSLEALMTKGGGVGPRALLSAGGRVYGGCLHGFSDLIATIAALGVASAVPAIGHLLPIIVFLVFEIIIALAVGVAVGELLAVGPHLRAVDGDIGAAGVVLFRLATKAKELRAGGLVALRRGRAVGDVEDVFEVPHVGVIDAQRLLIEAKDVPLRRLRIERAFVHVDGDVMLACAEIGVDLDHRAAGVKRAVFKRHGRRAVRPEGVIAIRGVERRVLEHSALIAPVVRLAVNDTIFNNGLPLDVGEAQVVDIAGILRHGTQRHVTERNGAGAFKRIVAVVLVFVVLWIGNLRTNAPRCLIGTGTHKRKILALGGTLRAHAVEGIVALAEQDGVVVLRLGGSLGKISVFYIGSGIGNRAGTRAGAVVCKSRRCNSHRDERNGKQRRDRTRGRFQKRLHAETPSTLKVLNQH